MFQSSIKDGRELFSFGEGEVTKEVDVTDWSDEDKSALRSELEAFDAESKATEEIAESIRKDAESPAELIRQARESKALIIDMRSSLEREKAESKVWRDLQKQHGKGRVMRLDTKDGMVCLRAPSEKEALEHYLSTAGISLAERVDATQEHILEMVVYPSKEEVKAIGAKWPLLWEDLENGLRGLQNARASEQGPFV